MTEYQSQIESVIAAYERLAESRENLLLRRGKLRKSSIRVRAKRVDTGNTEVEFMDRLRVWMNCLDGKIPSDIVRAYADVVRTRNELAVLEDDYLQAERQLTGVEWAHIDEDNDFYLFDLTGILKSLSKLLANTTKQDRQSPSRTPISSPHIPMQPQTNCNDAFGARLEVTTRSEQPPKPAAGRWCNAIQQPGAPIPQELLGLAIDFQDHSNKQAYVPSVPRETEDLLVSDHPPTLSLVDVDERDEDLQARNRPENVSKDARFVTRDENVGLSTVTPSRRDSPPALVPVSSHMSTSFDGSVACTEPALPPSSKDPWAESRITMWLEEAFDLTVLERTVRANDIQKAGPMKLSKTTWGSLSGNDNTPQDLDLTESLSDDVSQNLDTEDIRNSFVQIENGHPQDISRIHRSYENPGSNHQKEGTGTTSPHHALPVSARGSNRSSMSDAEYELGPLQLIPPDVASSFRHEDSSKVVPLQQLRNSSMREDQQLLSAHATTKHSLPDELESYDQDQPRLLCQPLPKRKVAVVNMRERLPPHEAVPSSPKSTRLKRMCILKPSNPYTIPKVTSINWKSGTCGHADSQSACPPLSRSTSDRDRKGRRYRLQRLFLGRSRQCSLSNSGNPQLQSRCHYAV